MSKGFSIAIDGPIASGKGTVATALANKLNGLFMSTGSMYRSVALLCLEKGIDINSEAEVAKILSNVNVDYVGKKVFLNGLDVTDKIRESDVSHASSVVAVYIKIREDLVKKQQQIAQKYIDRGQIVIADGRDTGTRVFPEAALKIFLTASLETRAKRSLERYKQKGVEMDLENVLLETEIRDKRDTERKVDPLPSNPVAFGYWVLDNSNQTENETVRAIMEELRKRGLINHDKH